ncbi:MAG: hypothetical protein Fur005_25390 [Roseiflexaceae bacterium]
MAVDYTQIGQLVQGMATEFAPQEVIAERARIAEEAGRSLSFFDMFQPKPGVEDAVRAGAIGSLLNLAKPALINRLQEVAIKESRLGIPLIIGSDVIHGFRTIFPTPLAESCTWNPDLLEQAARIAAEEASAHGIDWIFAPMVDIARDPRWGGWLRVVVRMWCSGRRWRRRGCVASRPPIWPAGGG